MSLANKGVIERFFTQIYNQKNYAAAHFEGDTFVGWHLGLQVAPSNFMMVSTGILKEHWRKGIYTALLPLVLERVKAEGFQVISSRHNMTNNAVIIPKLKAGFVISGFEVNDMYGSLVQLSYLFNPTRRKMLDARVGQAALDEEDKQRLLRGKRERGPE